MNRVIYLLLFYFYVTTVLAQESSYAALPVFSQCYQSVQVLVNNLNKYPLDMEAEYIDFSENSPEYPNLKGYVRVKSMDKSPPDLLEYARGLTRECNTRNHLSFDIKDVNSRESFFLYLEAIANTSKSEPILYLDKNIIRIFFGQVPAQMEYELKKSIGNK